MNLPSRRWTKPWVLRCGNKEGIRALKDEIISQDEIYDLVLKSERFHSAEHDEIKRGLTADIYFLRACHLLKKMGLDKTPVAAEIFASRAGLFVGVEEVLTLLQDLDLQVWALPEGAEMEEKEVVMVIRGAYGNFGFHETAILGFLAPASGWATAARRCCDAAQGRPVYSFGARHTHPAIAPVMERAAVKGGAKGSACIMGAKLLGEMPVGTMPHAAILIAGDTLKAARAFNQYMEPDVPRIILVDTFKDEAEEALRIAEDLQEDLLAVRLDTPSERGGVTPDLVEEVRYRLQQAGHGRVKILVSGGLDPEKIEKLVAAGADFFGVGSYIAREPAINMTMDLKEIDGKPLAKRGRMPGIRKNERLERFL